MLVNEGLLSVNFENEKSFHDEISPPNSDFQTALKSRGCWQSFNKSFAKKIVV